MRISNRRPLLGTIAAALAAIFTPVSHLGVETALEAMADATKAVIAADLYCFAAWCADNRRAPSLPIPRISYRKIKRR